MTNDALHVGKTIRAFRIRAGLTQERLSELADMDYSYIGHIERGTKNPSLKALGKLAEALGVSPADLVKPVSEASKSTRLPRAAKRDLLIRELLTVTKQSTDDDLRKLIKIARILVTK